MLHLLVVGVGAQSYEKRMRQSSVVWAMRVLLLLHTTSADATTSIVQRNTHAAAAEGKESSPVHVLAYAVLCAMLLCKLTILISLDCILPLLQAVVSCAQPAVALGPVRL
jgi:hypothetical protein